MSTLRSMAEALGPLIRAIEAVAAGAALDADDIAALAPVLRAAAPSCCPGAALDTVDVATIAMILRRRPDVLDLGPENPIIFDPDLAIDPRGEGPRRRAARAVIDAVTLALEAKKLAFGLPAPPAALKVAFSSPDEARAVLAAVVAVDGRVEVAGASAGLIWSPSLPPDRDVHVVAGAGARRLLDLLSPSVRRLRVELALAGRRGAAIDDDDVYRGLRRLHAADPRTVLERRAGDASEGVIEVDDGGGFVVDGVGLVEELVDRRARSLVVPLKKARAGIVGVVDSADLDRVLQAVQQEGRVVRSVHLLTPATATTVTDDEPPTSDGAVVDAASGHLWPGATRTATLSLPLLELAPPGVAADEDAFCLLQALAAAAFDGALPPTRRSLVVGDGSDEALAALAAMVQVTPR